jgi:hypothetical protein
MVCVTAMGMTACDKGPKKGELPKKDADRVASFANYLPASTEAMLVIGSIENFQKAAERISATLESINPDLKAQRQEAEKELGFTLTDAKSWADTGIDTKGGVAVAPVAGRIVMMTYVSDRQKFDSFLTEKYKKSSGEESAAPKVEKVGELEVKALGKEGQELHWAHDGKLVVLITKPMEDKFKTDEKPGQIIERLVKKTGKESMASTAEFKRFADAYDASYAITGFLNAKAVMSSPLFKDGLDDMAKDEQSKEGLEWLKKNAEIAGLGLAVVGDEIKLNALFGGSADFQKTVLSMGQGVPASPFDGFANNSTMLGLRVAVNGSAAWQAYKAVLPKEQAEEITKALKNASEASGIDVEKEFIENLSGNFGFFLYGADIGALAAMSDPTAALKSVSFALALEFKDNAKLTAALDKIISKAPPGEINAKDVSGAKVYPLPDNMGAFYVKDKLLAFASQPVKEDAAVGYLDGKTSDKKLSSDGKALGKAFGDKKGFNGLYLNITKIAEIASMVAAGNPVVQGLKKIEEASLSYDSKAQGLTMELRVLLAPPAK